MKRNPDMAQSGSVDAGVRVVSCDFVDRIYVISWIVFIPGMANDPRTHTNGHEWSMAELILKDEVFQIIGAAMDVYFQLGRRFGEPIYQEAFEIELGRRGIPFKPQCEVNVYYKGHALTRHYVPDVICFDTVIAELKVCDRLTGLEESQILNYLKATRMHVGLLINFGSRGTLEWKRYVL